MILINGNIIPSDEINNILPTLEQQVCKTLMKPQLDPMAVVEACHQLAKRFEQGIYEDIMRQLIGEEHITPEQIRDVVCMFQRDNLLFKINQELGELPVIAGHTPPVQDNGDIRRKRMPLGVLFHIAAGNVDGLPAYSVIEGLLAGNINILKLPSADHGFTVRLLSELVKLEPTLAEYIYVFDVSSNDIVSMKAMAKCANAIVVWGGDAAISSVRSLASPNTKIIEWGHKMSFVYLTEQGITEEALTGLAHHILSTKQLLCSSCQGIFFDTGDLSTLYAFCERFIHILDEVAHSYPEPGIGLRAQINLMLYNEELNAVHENKKLYSGRKCSIIASDDKKLEVSFTNGNCWAKMLPRRNIINRLHRYKNYLQTVGLLCGPDEREALSQLLLRAGATRITEGYDMSRMLCGETHDGEYPLQRYSRIVEY
jgi:hypothetical protein